MFRSLALVCLAMVSCGAIRFRIPRLHALGAEADVFADTPEDAARVAVLFDELAPKVRSILGDVRNRRARVAVLDPSKLHNALGMNWGSWIFVASGYEGYERTILAHELVHWQRAGPWECLPGVIEEGLADSIAADLDPVNAGITASANLEALQAPVISDPTISLAMSRDEVGHSHGRDPHGTLANSGYFITERIGIEGLRALCIRARHEGHRLIPVDWILKAADLPNSDVRQWPYETLVTDP